MSRWWVVCRLDVSFLRAAWQGWVTCEHGWFHNINFFVLIVSLPRVAPFASDTYFFSLCIIYDALLPCLNGDGSRQQYCPSAWPTTWFLLVSSCAISMGNMDVWSRIFVFFFIVCGTWSLVYVPVASYRNRPLETSLRLTTYDKTHQEQC